MCMLPNKLFGFIWFETNPPHYLNNSKLYIMVMIAQFILKFDQEWN